MPRLQVFQSIWAMERRRPDGLEWSLEESIEKIAEAGFDGLDVYLHRADEARRAKKLLDARGLGMTLCAFPRSMQDIRDSIDLVRELDAVHLNLIAQVYPFTVEEGAEMVRPWLQACREAGVPVLVETHRDCLTTDLFYTLQLIEAVPEIRLCADLSHYLVGREFSWPISEENHALVRRILERSDAFQGRVASREQVQIQIGFAQHREWLELFLSWWEAGFRSWRSRQSEDARLNFLCELGPKEYAMTGADGYELSDRFEEAVEIKRLVHEIWARLEREASAGNP